MSRPQFKNPQCTEMLGRFKSTTSLSSTFLFNFLEFGPALATLTVRLLGRSLLNNTNTKGENFGLTQ
uniref:Uncharacterized protein n=1 Tax=Anguilla anguilla TaxID=7936 RepID=A0A0E9XKE1_ANGAN